MASRRLTSFGVLDADEHVGEAGVGAHFQHLGVARRIDRDLRGETDFAVGLPRVPFLYGGEQFLRAGAVDGEIVVGEEHGSIAEPVQRIEFAQHQIDRLVPLLAPDILDHIAELALERHPREVWMVPMTARSLG